MITQQKIDEIRSVVEKSTGGKLKVVSYKLDKNGMLVDSGYSVWQDIERPFLDSPKSVKICESPEGYTTINADNMRCISVMRNNILDLLDELEYLQGKANLNE